MIDPWKAVLCIILYLVIQFIEGHFIYPRVIGNSIGLSTFWVFASMIIGQSLFSIFGMIFFDTDGIRPVHTAQEGYDPQVKTA